MKLVAGAFPSKGLTYPKGDEPPPFTTREEIERLPADDRDWDALYLTIPEIDELLALVRDRDAHAWSHPMVTTAAYTGARRSELLRMRVTDVDFAGGPVIVRERKRSKGKRSTWRVPLTAPLAAVLRAWLAAHPGGTHLCCQPEEVARSKKRSRTTGHQNGDGRATTAKGRLATVRDRERPGILPLTAGEAHDHPQRTLAGSRWEVVKGWHVCRHSFISACASRGIDQRHIDEWVGHTTEEMRRRYRHLYPSVQRKALGSEFDGVRCSTTSTTATASNPSSRRSR
jgi:integrase